MKLYLLIFLLVSSNLYANTEVKVLPEASSPHQFVHQNLGCLENSECDQVMGHQLSRWSKIIKDQNMNPKTKRLELSKHLKENGIPTDFYTVQKVDRFFKPMLFNSHCRNHNPSEGAKTLRGTAFLKSLTLDKAIIWRDQTQIEYFPDQQLIAQPIKVYFTETPTLFMAGLDDQPLFIKNQKLYILKEYDEEFFLLEISQDGSWNIVDMDLTKLTFYEDKKIHMQCPHLKSEMPKEFEVKFCKGIWDESKDRLIPTEMYQGCAN